MDHLAVTKAPALRYFPDEGLKLKALTLRDDTRSVRVPYLARKEYMWKETLDKENICLTHGQRTGWEIRLRAGKFDEHEAKDAISFIQSWLFFGLLEEILKTPIRIDDFIRSEDNKQYVTTERMPEMMYDWQVRIHRSSWEEQKRHKSNIEMILLGLRMTLKRLFPYREGAWYRRAPLAEEVLLSIGILGETLEWSKMRIFNKIELDKTTVMKGSFLLYDDTAGGSYLFRKMIAEGW